MAKEDWSEVGVEILHVLRRIERLVDAGFKALLNAKYPHGKPTDRWR
jgi:hypothetical protein